MAQPLHDGDLSLELLQHLGGERGGAGRGARVRSMWVRSMWAFGCGAQPSVGEWEGGCQGKRGKSASLLPGGSAVAGGKGWGRRLERAGLRGRRSQAAGGAGEARAQMRANRRGEHEYSISACTCSDISWSSSRFTATSVWRHCPRYTSPVEGGRPGGWGGRRAGGRRAGRAVRLCSSAMAVL